MKATITVGAEPSIAYQKTKFEITTEIEYTDLEDLKNQVEAYQHFASDLAALEVKNLREKVNGE